MYLSMSWAVRTSMKHSVPRVSGAYQIFKKNLWYFWSGKAAAHNFKFLCISYSLSLSHTHRRAHAPKCILLCFPHRSMRTNLLHFPKRTHAIKVKKKRNNLLVEFVSADSFLYFYWYLISGCVARSFHMYSISKTP